MSCQVVLTRMYIFARISIVVCTGYVYAVAPSRTETVDRSSRSWWRVTSYKVFMTYEAQRLSDRALLDVMWAAKQNSITTVSRPPFFPLQRTMLNRR